LFRIFLFVRVQFITTFAHIFKSEHKKLLRFFILTEMKTDGDRYLAVD